LDNGLGQSDQIQELLKKLLLNGKGVPGIMGLLQGLLDPGKKRAPGTDLLGGPSNTIGGSTGLSALLSTPVSLGLGSCVTARFEIEMADGTVKNADSIEIGDRVAGPLDQPQTVVAAFSYEPVPCVQIATDGEFWAPVSITHKVQTPDGDQEIQNLRIGDEILCTDGGVATITYYARTEELPVWNFTVEPDHVYIGYGCHQCNTTGTDKSGGAG
jgi:hypothetical protein